MVGSIHDLYFCSYSIPVTQKILLLSFLFHFVFLFYYYPPLSQSAPLPLLHTTSVFSVQSERDLKYSSKLNLFYRIHRCVWHRTINVSNRVYTSIGSFAMHKAMRRILIRFICARCSYTSNYLIK